MKRNDGVYFYQSIVETIRKMAGGDMSKAGEAFFAVADYALYDREYEGGDLTAEVALINARPLIDKAQEDHENGKTGGRGHKKSETEKTEKTEKTKGGLEKDKGGFRNSKTYQDIDKDVDEDKDKDKDKDIFLEKTSPVGDEKKSPKKTGFVKPSVEEVREYCAGKGYGFDPEAFIAFYESNGWRVSRNPMKDWKMACVTWQKKFEEDRRRDEERRERYDRDRSSPPPKEQLKSPFPEYSDEEWNKLTLWQQDEAVHKYYGI